MTTSATPETLPSLHLPRRLALPDFPWDSLTPYRERAAQHPDGVVDLAVGTPVDPTPEIARNALFSAANAPGYPTAGGAPAGRAAITEWVGRRRGGGGPGGPFCSTHEERRHIAGAATKGNHVLIAQRPTLTEEVVVEDRRSRFVLEPLEPGFGYTLGNSLRRTLLSSIPGAAVTSVRIDGVPHEFRTIPGVKEDVAQIILNIKEIVLSSENDEPVVMYLRKSGPSEVTAGDITPPAGVEIHNPDLVIATLNEKGKLEIELTVERGRGYVSANQNKDPNAEISRIPVDSIYSPVKKVSYSVEATRVEQRTDFDRLIVDVETKSSITPRDALASAGKTLVELFGLARELNVEAEGIEVGPSPIDEAFQQDLALMIDELDLQARSSNALKREGIHTVGELVSRSEADLLDIRNFGAKSISEIKDKLAELGLSLKGSPVDYVSDDDYANPTFSDETQA